MTRVAAGRLLQDPAVRAAIREAWVDSEPGIIGGHEEGGFILQDPTGTLSVSRWPPGSQTCIRLPPHPGCRVGPCDIVATFHTHPNSGEMFLQEPGATDRRAVRDDPDLRGSRYQGELVISQETVFLVAPDGGVMVVGPTEELLDEY